MTRTDPTRLTLGLIFLMIAVLGVRAAFGGLTWAEIGLFAPLALVALGALGISLTRRP